MGHHRFCPNKDDEKLYANTPIWQRPMNASRCECRRLNEQDKKIKALADKIVIPKTKNKMPDIREELSDLCHKQWSGWMEYMFSKGIRGINGAWVMPKEFVDRWTRQMSTPYSELSKAEQDSDRKEADKFLEIINKGETTNGI